MKRLPIEISDFKKLREKNFIYLDKTTYIYKLIQEGRNCYFRKPKVTKGNQKKLKETRGN